MNPRKERLLILFEPELLAAIDALRRTEPDIPPRAVMIRRLVECGLATKRTEQAP